MRHIAPTLVVILLVASSPARGQGDQPQRVSYQDHRLVHAELTTQKQLDRLLGGGAVVLDCCVGVGPLDLVVPPDALGLLDGIEHEIRHDDVGALITAERERIDQSLETLQQLPIGPVDLCATGWWSDYKPLEEIMSRIDALEAAYPAVEKFSIGTSFQGRDIPALRITAPGGAPGRPAVLWTGCQHAREWVAPMTTMYIATQLACGYDDGDPQIVALLDQLELIIVPMVNPDGYKHSWDFDRFWRKNRRDNFPDYGVDLNRNWGVDWGGPESTSSDPGNDLYYGTGPFSEPETAAVRDLIVANPQIVAHIDFHSYGQVILQPWGHTNDLPPDYDVIHDLGGLMDDAAFSVHGFPYPHGSGNSQISYLASGVMPDWCYGDQGVFSYTIELRPSSPAGGAFELPALEILPTGEENFAAILAMSEWATQGVQIIYPLGLPASLVPDVSTPLSVSLTGTYDAVAPGTERLLARIGTSGPFQETTLTPLGGADYEAVLPAAPCGAVVQYYIELDTTDGATLRSPADAPAVVHEATALQIVASFDFESDPLWTVTTTAIDGGWDRGVPVGGGDRGDPPTDFDGSGQCWLTDNVDGNSDVDAGATILTTEAFDMTGGGSIGYAYWLGDVPNGELGVEDSLAVEYATDAGGTNWVPANVYTATTSSWVLDAVTLDDVTATATVRLRFIATEDDPGGVLEAGIDAVEVLLADCPTDPCVADVSGNDGTVNTVDLLDLLAAWGGSDPIFDIAPPGGDGTVDTVDLLALLAAWGDCSP